VRIALIIDLEAQFERDASVSAAGRQTDLAARDVAIGARIAAAHGAAVLGHVLEGQQTIAVRRQRRHASQARRRDSLSPCWPSLRQRRQRRRRGAVSSRWGGGGPGGGGARGRRRGCRVARVRCD
jgi:hypothetical protein